jgi:hypothetical protein
MTRNHRLSEFVKSLGKYRIPRPGEELATKYGKARVLRIIPYEEVVEEMRNGNVPENEIEQFNLRVEHFLGRKSRYFECEVANADGEVEQIDWSEYLAMKNRKER